MKAKCPYCAGAEATDCKECGGTGFIEVSFAAGTRYSIICSRESCGRYIGGFVVGRGSPYKTLEDYDYRKSCPSCGAPVDFRKGEE